MYLSNWLASHAPRVPGKFVCFNNGELGNNREVVTLFERAGYTVQLTGPDASSMNGPVERRHQDIGNALRAMLHGAGLDFKFWPYAFHHHLRIHNLCPPSDGSQPSPYEICSGHPFKDYLSLRMFGSCVYVQPPGRRPSKLQLYASIGLFLGYSRTQSVILFLDETTSQVKTAQHFRFDEAHNDMDNPPPNARNLWCAAGQDIPPPDPDEVPPIELDVTSNPFLKLVTETIDIKCDDPYFGFQVSPCAARYRAYLLGVTAKSSLAALRNVRCQYIGAYIVAINNQPVFMATDVYDALTSLHNATEQVPLFNITLAPEQYVPISSTKELPLHLHLDQLLPIHALHHGTGEGGGDNFLSDDCLLFDRPDLEEFLSSAVRALSSVVDATPEERALPAFT